MEWAAGPIVLRIEWPEIDGVAGKDIAAQLEFRTGKLLRGAILNLICMVPVPNENYISLWAARSTWASGAVAQR